MEIDIHLPLLDKSCHLATAMVHNSCTGKYHGCAPQVASGTPAAVERSLWTQESWHVGHFKDNQQLVGGIKVF